MATDLGDLGTTFSISDTKICIPVVTLPIQDMQKCLNYQNLLLKERLTGININQKKQQKNKTSI